MNDPRSGKVLPILGLALVWAVTGGSAEAQEAAEEEAPIRVGSRIRVTTTGDTEPIMGRVKALDGGVLQLYRVPDYEVVSVSPNSIRRLEVSQTRRSGMERAMPGIFTGGMAGLAIGILVTERSSCGPEDFLCIEISGKFLGGVLGAMLGAVAGGLLSRAIVPAESWTTVPSARVTVSAGSGGAEVGLVVPVSRKDHRRGRRPGRSPPCCSR